MDKDSSEPGALPWSAFHAGPAAEVEASAAKDGAAARPLAATAAEAEAFVVLVALQRRPNRYPEREMASNAQKTETVWHSEA